MFMICEQELAVEPEFKAHKQAVTTKCCQKQYVPPFTSAESYLFVLLMLSTDFSLSLF